MKRTTPEKDSSSKPMRASDINTLFERSVIYTKTVINGLEQPFLLLSKDYKVIGANASYYSLFKETAKNIQGASLYAIGNEVWNIPQLKKILKKITVDDTAFLKGFEVKKEFPKVGKKFLVLSVRHVFTSFPHEKKNSTMLILSIEDATELMGLAQLLVEEYKEVKKSPSQK